MLIIVAIDSKVDQSLFFSIYKQVCEELEVKRQAEYIAAVTAWDAAEADKKSKETADKEASEILFNKREVKRLRKKLESRLCPADPLLHPMANSKIISKVLQQDEFDKRNLQNFCLIGKAWVLPCRTLMFVECRFFLVLSTCIDYC